MTAANQAGLGVRPYELSDERAVLDLLHESLRHAPDDEYASYITWKHRLNPFGASPAWVATDGLLVVGLRMFMRWEFTRGEEQLRAVRAVDTATLPAYQGRGIFRRLTLHGLDQLAAEGVHFVFNTPNDKSRPGYLKMGWHDVGRLPILARLQSPRALRRVVQARVPSNMWSLPAATGEAAVDVMADRAALATLLASQPPTSRMQTRRTSEFLQWRYGFASLAYRTMLAGPSVEDGIAIFRLRRRGPAIEAVVADVLVPEGSRSTARRLLRDIARRSGADYAVRVANSRAPRAGYVPLPGQGPRLTWRAVTNTAKPALDDWELSLGDIELF